MSSQAESEFYRRQAHQALSKWLEICPQSVYSEEFPYTELQQAVADALRDRVSYEEHCRDFYLSGGNK